MQIRIMKLWALPLFIASASQEVIARYPTYSWGKPRVSRTDYDNDAIACSLQAASRDVVNDKETQGYLQGFESLERENNMPPMARSADEEGLVSQANRNVLLRRMYNPDRRVDSLQNKLQNEVVLCLTARGYTRFVLSKDQSKKLEKLTGGSPERRDFLYGLGSSADIISAQRVGAEDR